MKNNKKEINGIENEVFKTLHCLDGMDKVKASPFFYKRVQQKLEYPEMKGVFQMLQGVLIKRFQPVLVPVFVAASILLGIFIGTDVSSDGRSENLESFASTYGIEAPKLNNYQLFREASPQTEKN